MRCDSCGYISFRFDKKCPSCNATIRQSKGALEPALSIFGSSGMGMGEDSGLDHDGMDSLDSGLHEDEYGDNLGVASPEAEKGDFDLDLSDAQTISKPIIAEPATIEVAPEIPVPSATEEEVDMQFDVESTTDDLDDMQVDDLGFDFDNDNADVEAKAEDSGEIELSLDEPDEIVADFDLDSVSDAEPSVDLDSEISLETDTDAEPSVDLDSEISLETDTDSLDLGLSMDDDTEPSLDLDLDPPPEK